MTAAWDNASDIFTVFDREGLPSEGKFGEITWPQDTPLFSKQEIKDRTNAIHARCPFTDPFAIEKHAAQPTAWLFNAAIEAGVYPEETNALWKKLFGGPLEEDSSGPFRVTRAVLFPPSPFLKPIEYQNTLATIQTSRTPSPTIKKLSEAHEEGHVYYPYTAQEVRGDMNAYFFETWADCYAVDKHPDRADARDWIHMHRLAAFFDGHPPKYWTAAACEAFLGGNDYPLFPEAFAPVRELQIRVSDALHGIDRSSLDATACREECSYTVAYLERGKIKHESIWNSLHSPFMAEFRKFSPAALMETLGAVLEKTKPLSYETRKEGEAVLEAYARLCPDEPRNFAEQTCIVGRLTAREPS